MGRRPTRCAAWPASAGGRRTSARCRATSSGPCSATTSTPSASPSGPAHRTPSTPTGRCIIVVTPDAQRTMNTYLGVSSLLSSDDLDEAAIADGAVLYMEGYLFDRDDAKKAFRRAAGIAHANGRKVSLTLSDSFCVDRHRDDFAALVRDEVDILFGNEDELCSLYQLASLDDAIAAVRAECELAAITAGKDGSYVVTADDVVQVPADEVARVLDTTGAGDLYAAGFLYGYTRSLPLPECARLGLDRRRRGDQPRRPPAARGAAYIVAVTAAEARSVAERWLAAEPDHDIRAELRGAARRPRRRARGAVRRGADVRHGRSAGAGRRRAAADEPARRAPGGAGAGRPHPGHRSRRPSARRGRRLRRPAQERRVRRRHGPGDGRRRARRCGCCRARCRRRCWRGR